MKIIREIDGVKIVHLSEEETQNIYGDVNPYTEEGFVKFRSFLETNGISYYGRPKESFFEYQGIRQAKEEGNEFLIMENMS